MLALGWERDPVAFWLHEVQSRGVKMGLERIRAALGALDNPQHSFPSVLIGGTNGKGSTVSFLRELMVASRLRVGSTISPHLNSYRERFCVDGEQIHQSDLEAVMRQMRPHLEGNPAFAELTFFELGVLVAMRWFAAQDVDWAVVEVGMGGEFDATRAAEPKLGAVVTVDLDHQRFLGSDPAEIARTKARIAPEGGVLVTGEWREDRISVIREECEAKGCALWRIGEDFVLQPGSDGLSYRGPGLSLDGVRLGPKGVHQQINAAVALALLEAASIHCGLRLGSKEALRSALARTEVAGRLESWQGSGEQPSVLLDGAHNPAAAARLSEYLGRADRLGHRWWIFAAMQDKELGPMVEQLLPHVDGVLCTAGTSSDRFVAPALLQDRVSDLAGDWNGSVEAVDDPQEALRQLLARLGPRDEVLVAGSLYLVGELRAALY